MTFIIGQGSSDACRPPIQRYSGSSAEFAAASATAQEVAISAFPPSFSLFSLPSSSAMRASTCI